MLRTAFLSIVVFAAAFGQSSSAPPLFTEKPTANDLRADVSFLASDALEGRGTPSKGLDIAAEWIASQFRRAGLEPAGGEGYFQLARYEDVSPNRGSLLLKLETAGGEIPAEASSIGIQEAAGLDIAHAEVFRASLESLDNLKPEQVHGKVLVVDAPASGGRGISGFARRIAANTARLQPLLVVSLRTNGQGVPAGKGLREVNAGGPVVPILVVWDHKIREALQAAPEGLIDAKLTAHIAAPNVTPVALRNVIGVLRGSDATWKDTYVMVTAHYDHLGTRGPGSGDRIFNGANDDASGTASLVEIANTLAAAPTRPKRSVIFMALFGEELGLLGSRYYARHPVVPLVKTVADLNLEQLGRTDDNSGPHVGMLNVTGFDYSSVTSVLVKAGEDTGVRVIKDEEASDAYFSRSDNQALADAGVPAHTLSVAYDFPDYHGAGDEWPKLDYENMAKVDRAIALAIWRMADSAEVPRWNPENPKASRYVKAYEMLMGQ